MDDVEALLEADYQQKAKGDDAENKDTESDENQDSKHRSHRSRRHSSRSSSPGKHRHSSRHRSHSSRRSSRHRDRSRSPRHRSSRRSRSPVDQEKLRKEQEERELEREQRTVFAFSLPMDAKERDIHEFFEEHAGPVRDVKLITDRHSRKSKGFGYVEFKDKEIVKKAIEVSGTQWRGHTVMVQHTQAEKNRIAAQNKANQPTPVARPGFPIVPGPGMVPINPMLQKRVIGPTRIYVGSLHFNITQDEVKKIFEPFGEIEFVNLHIGHETGRSKGFAFVQFKDPESAKKALIKVNGMEVAGRQLKVGLVNESSTQNAGGLGELDDDEGGGLSLNAQSRAVLMEKLQRGNQADTTNPATPIPVQPQIQPVVAPSLGASGTPCIVIRNMFDSKALSDPAFEEELKEDLLSEGKKFGNIVHLHIATQHLLVYMKYANIAQAQAATLALNGRWFDGRQLIVTYMTEAEYYVKFPESLGVNRFKS